MEILSKNEIKILNLYRKNIYLKSTIRNIMKETKSKSYQRIHESTKKLIKKNILKEEKIGNSNLITLKLSRQTIINLAYLDEQESFKIPNYKTIIEIQEIKDFIIIVTGSYAKGTQTKKSDLDLVIITPNNKDIVKIQKKVEHKTMLLIPEIHLYVFTNKDFTEMIQNKEENYGKEILKNKIILKNAQNYYELIKETNNL